MHILQERKGTMGKIKVTGCEIEGVKIIEPEVLGDERGWFMEAWHEEDYERAGLACTFVQDNRSYSRKGVLRGLHFQKKYPQDKLLSVLRGEIFDVAVDIREGSQTYGKWFGIRLSAENRKQLFIPKGMAHGYLVLSEEAEIFYKCSERYHPEDEGGICWNDEKIGIEWPIGEGAGILLSERDKMWKGLE